MNNMLMMIITIFHLCHILESVKDITVTVQNLGSTRDSFWYHISTWIYETQLVVWFLSVVNQPVSKDTTIKCP